MPLARNCAPNSRVHSLQVKYPRPESCTARANASACQGSSNTMRSPRTARFEYKLLNHPVREAHMSKELSPARAIMDLAVAYWASRCLHVVAELGVADALGEARCDAESLAQRTRSQPQALHRVLRALANHGIFEHDGEKFRHNAASRMLRSDVPGSLRSLARMMGLKVHWDAYRELDVAVRTGQPSIAAVTEGGLFAHLRSHPEEARLFHEAMEGKSFMQLRPVVESYDFRGLQCIGDIGGGLGHLLDAVLERVPDARGVLFDLPAVIEHARRRN